MGNNSKVIILTSGLFRDNVRGQDSIVFTFSSSLLRVFIFASSFLFFAFFLPPLLTALFVCPLSFVLVLRLTIPTTLFLHLLPLLRTARQPLCAASFLEKQIARPTSAAVHIQQQLQSLSSLTAQPTNRAWFFSQLPDMATYASQQVFHQPLSVDTKHSQSAHGYFDDDNVLDDGVLDSSALDSGLEMSPHMVDSRRDSFAIAGSALISPATKADDWHSSVEMESLPSNNPWYGQQQQTSNPFAQGAQFPMQPQAWNFSGEYVGNMMMPGQASYPNHTNIFAHLAAENQTQGHGQQQQSQTPSPQERATGSGQSKSTRPVSPALRAKIDDASVRKKNARQYIPENHTLATIDTL